MNCTKCNQPMKAYHGLVETGWDCVNTDCGKGIIYYKDDADFYGTDGNVEIKLPKASPDPGQMDIKDAIKAMQDALIRAYGMPSTDASDALDSKMKPILPGDDPYSGSSMDLLTMEEWFVETAKGADLDRLAKLYNVERHLEESVEDFRFRFLAHFD